MLEVTVKIQRWNERRQHPVMFGNRAIELKLFNKSPSTCPNIRLSLWALFQFSPSFDFSLASPPITRTRPLHPIFLINHDPRLRTQQLIPSLSDQMFSWWSAPTPGEEVKLQEILLIHPTDGCKTVQTDLIFNKLSSFYTRSQDRWAWKFLVLTLNIDQYYAQYLERLCWYFTVNNICDC